MNRNWKTSLLAGLAAILTTSASAFAQNAYYGGACEPAACAPTCDVPTCDVPSCAPTCGYGCDEGDCGYGGGCCDPCCVDVASIFNGALDVATAPIRWVASALTDGIYPDCGCAARPPKSNCNPCDVCGNYVGGCNDYCEGGACAAGCASNDYSANYASNYYSGGAGGYSGGAYPVGAYDPNDYDASPTNSPRTAPAKTNADPETLPPEAIERNDYSAIPGRRVRPNVRKSFDVATLINGSRDSGAVRQVSFEERRILNDLAAQARAERAAATQSVPAKRTNLREERQSAAREFESRAFVPQENVVYVERPVYLDRNGRPVARQTSRAESTGDAARANVETVGAETVRSNGSQRASGKTFGQTKPIR